MTKFSVALAATAFVFAAAQAAPALAASAPEPAPVQSPAAPAHRVRAAAETVELSVVGRGVVQAPSDVMRINVGVEVRRERAGEAYAAVKVAGLKLTRALLAAGVAEQDVRTSDLSLGAEYDKYPKVVGYRATEGAEALVRDLSRADAVVDAVAGVGEEVRLNGISFEVSKEAALVKAARAAAFRDAQHKARQYAVLSGRRLGRVLKLEEEGDSPPSRFAMMSEKGSINPGHGSVTITVRVVYELI
ncbi:SIMPL domain-containing protein [Sphaerisporangium dianthi]|uniref:SIMPL domain-containing protein n=1 Tax=Sphaerisporangium dianthi TaxID=1436120 RepID=A0ABV9CHH4_9ACTN